MEIVWPWLAPTWNCAELKLPSITFRPLKEVWVATRSISEASCETSCCRAARSEELLVALADCTANSRMRCRLSLTAPRAPSAVCASEMPSLALRAAWVIPLICDVMRLAIAIPAAPSLALLMRRPEDRRCREVVNADCDEFRLRCALREATLVLIVDDIWISWSELT